MLDRLTPEERQALHRLRDELFPRHTVEAVAHKLLRDALIGCGMLRLGTANRSKWAQQKALSR